MNKKEKFEEIKLSTVKIETKNGNGTGVLIFRGKTAYILTVHHCIYGKKEPYHNPVEKDIFIIFDSKISKSTMNPTKFKSYENSIVYLEMDINKINDKNIELNIPDEIISDEDYSLRGYPKGAQDAQRFDAKYNDNINKKEFRITAEYLTSDTSENDANDFVSGLSGSGVFFYKKNKLYLNGLVNSLVSETGIFRAVNCIKLPEFNHDILNKEDIKECETVLVDFPHYGYSAHVFKYLVTFEEFDEFCNQNNKTIPEDYSYNFSREKYPVVNISLNEANEYCNWLSNKNNRKYRLAKSTEWDYIAKKNKIPENHLDEYIWHNKNSKDIQPIATKKPGELGIYDMYGNVNEWCLDGKIRGDSIKHKKEKIIKEKNNTLPPATTAIPTLGFRVIIEK